MQTHDKEGIDGGHVYEFPCPDCPKTFEKKASLIQHSQIHNRKKTNKTKAVKSSKIKDDEQITNRISLETEENTEENTSLNNQLLNIQSEKEDDGIHEEEQETKDFIEKHEIEVTPQIFEGTLEDYEDNDEWFDHEDDCYEDDTE